MHKWESQEKLLSEWEAQDMDSKFIYKDFTYKRDEFDNVPPVVPRWLFHLQLNLKPVIRKIHDELDLQTTASLKKEVVGWLKQIQDKVQEERQQAIEREA